MKTDPKLNPYPLGLGATQRLEICAAANGRPPLRASESVLASSGLGFRVSDVRQASLSVTQDQSPQPLPQPLFLRWGMHLVVCINGGAQI